MLFIQQKVHFQNDQTAGGIAAANAAANGAGYITPLVLGYTNGGEGYYATAEAYDQGGYEPRNSRFLKGVAETLTQTGVDLLKSM